MPNNNYEEISPGSYGQVTIIDNTTILKTTDKFRNDKSYYKQNIQEAIFLATIGNLNNNNIVKTKEITITGSKLHFKQEKGEMTLHDYINKTSRAERLSNFKTILFNIIKSLYYLHKNGFIHGDIKPNNILISKDLSINLIDFGGICSFRLNNNHRTICTPSFCPPEGWPQLKLNNLYTKFDIWSLGATMYYYVCKKYLLDFKDDKTIYYVNEFKWSFSKFYHHDINDIKDKISNTEFELMEKMLMYDPDDRISSDELYYDPYFDQFHKEQIQKIIYDTSFDTSFMVNFMTTNWLSRNNMICWIYEYCKEHDIMDHIVLSVWLIDKYCNTKKKKVTCRNYKLLACSAIYLSSIMISNISLNFDNLLNRLSSSITTVKLINTIDDFLITLKFKIYVPTFDYIIKQQKIKIDYNLLVNFLLKRKYIGIDQYNLVTLFLSFLKVIDGSGSMKTNR